MRGVFLWLCAQEAAGQQSCARTMPWALCCQAKLLWFPAAQGCSNLRGAQGSLPPSVPAPQGRSCFCFFAPLPFWYLLCTETRQQQDLEPLFNSCKVQIPGAPAGPAMPRQQLLRAAFQAPKASTSKVLKYSVSVLSISAKLFMEGVFFFFFFNNELNFLLIFNF